MKGRGSERDSYNKNKTVQKNRKAVNTMKTFLKSTVLCSVIMVLTYGSALAVPFSSSGFADPNYSDSWDADSGTGIARFELTIDENWPQVDYVTLEFESDIFDFTGWDASDITVVNPDDWTTTLSSNASGYEFSLSTAGTDATTSIILDVAYTLLDAAMYTDATGDGWAWDEGQAWALSYTMGDSSSLFTTSGGSTGPPVPEPATMLLFSCGLAGLAALRGRRAKRGV